MEIVVSPGIAQLGDRVLFHSGIVLADSVLWHRAQQCAGLSNVTFSHWNNARPKYGQFCGTDLARVQVQAGSRGCRPCFTICTL